MFKSLFWAALLSVLAVGSTAVDSSLRGHELSLESDARVLAPACDSPREIPGTMHWTQFMTEVQNCLAEGESCSPPLPCWDVSKVTDMNRAFVDSNLKNIDLSNWKTGKVTSMERMFSSTQFSFSLANWDVSSVTNMASMFKGSVVTDPNLDLTLWQTGKVKKMSYMFYGAGGVNPDTNKWDSSFFNPDVTTWDTSEVTDMSWMFKDTGFNRDIDSWDISRVRTMGYMFAGSPFNQCLPTWPGIKKDNVVTKNMFDGTGCTQTEVTDDQTTWCHGEGVACAVAPEPSDPVPVVPEPVPEEPSDPVPVVPAPEPVPQDPTTPEPVPQEPSDPVPVVPAPEPVPQDPTTPEPVPQDSAACENAAGAFKDSNDVSETCDQRVARLNTPKQYHELCDDELAKKGCPGVCNWDRCSCTDYPTTFYPKGFEMTCTASGSARTIPDKQPGTSNHCRGLNRLLCRGTCLPMCNRDVGQSTR